MSEREREREREREGGRKRVNTIGTHMHRKSAQLNRKCISNKIVPKAKNRICLHAYKHWSSQICIEKEQRERERANRCLVKNGN